MAQTSVSGPVVVDGESFSDALFSRLLAKAEALGSIHYKFRVDVDERSTGGLRLEAFSRPRTVSSSETSNRGV